MKVTAYNSKVLHDYVYNFFFYSKNNLIFTMYKKFDLINVFDCTGEYWSSSREWIYEMNVKWHRDAGYFPHTRIKSWECWRWEEQGRRRLRSPRCSGFVWWLGTGGWRGRSHRRSSQPTLPTTPGPEELWLGSLLVCSRPCQPGLWIDVHPWRREDTTRFLLQIITLYSSRD